MEAQFERLYLETLGIGEIMQIIFGRQAAEQYSQLLSQYAIIVNELITAQLARDLEAVNQSVEQLYQNVDVRSDFLQNMNPYWSAEQYRQLFYSFIEHMIETANAIASGDSAREIELYDILNAHTDRMGDTFAEGIYAYLTSGSPPAEINVPCITLEQMNDIYTIRMFWFELAVWIRMYMLSRYAGTGDPEQIFARLTEVPVRFVNAMKKFFPEIDVEDYLQRFTTYLNLLADFITAMLENDVEELNRVTRSLYENADDRAAFVDAINPFWEEEPWRELLYANLRNTIEESSTFLLGDYERNIDIFTRLLDLAETSSTFLAQGIFYYITQNQQTAVPS
jgi:tetratricopeptide (TPR) repeat protein